jgi:hypothetical protein
VELQSPTAPLEAVATPTAPSSTTELILIFFSAGQVLYRWIVRSFKRFDESVFLRRSIFSNFQFYAEMAEKLHYEI